MKKIALAATVLAAFAALPAAANVLVVRSSGPSAKTFPPGHNFPDTAQVTLRPGDVLTVLGGHATRTIRGPGTFPIAAGGAARMADASRRGRFSAMRAGEMPPSPSVWHLDVTQSGTVCTADGTRPQLWRADAAEKVTLTVQPASGAARTLQWDAGKDVLDWPADLPATASAAYELSWDGSTDKSRLVFASVGAQPQDDQTLASALIAKNCRNQLDTLLEKVPDESAAAH